MFYARTFIDHSGMDRMSGVFVGEQKNMERETRLELATTTLATWSSTTELFPLMEY